MKVSEMAIVNLQLWSELTHMGHSDSDQVTT